MTDVFPRREVGEFAIAKGMLVGVLLVTHCYGKIVSKGPNLVEIRPSRGHADSSARLSDPCPISLVEASTTGESLWFKCFDNGK